MKDKNGIEIKAGDTLFNPWDRDLYHTVLQDSVGHLFLGDFDSPLERYGTHKFWEVVTNITLAQIWPYGKDLLEWHNEKYPWRQLNVESGK